MKYSPFPYKLSATGELCDGAFVTVPSYCTKIEKSAVCMNHYKKLFRNQTNGIIKCPHGFGSCGIKIGNQEIVLSCLNIEKETDRRCIKLVKNDQFFPRITFMQFNKIVSEYLKILHENIETTEAKVKFEKELEKLHEGQILLENTLHEIRKINNQLKSSVELFTNEYSKNKFSFDKLNSLCTDIYQNADLLSIRFDTYDFEVNPELNKNTIQIDIPIYKRVEKIYKCLNSKLKEKGLRFIMNGNSYNLYHTSNVLEIGLFILIDNAIKYSLSNSAISAKFVEDGDKLYLTFNNMGIRPSEEELRHLTERGYRSKKIANSKEFEGRGIGLYLFKKICEYTNVEYKIRLGNENKYQNGYRYSPFMVELKFENMILDDKNLLSL